VSETLVSNIFLSKGSKYYKCKIKSVIFKYPGDASASPHLYVAPPILVPVFILVYHLLLSKEHR